MKGTKETINAIKAGYSYFYCQTYEMNRTVENLFEELKTFSENSSLFNEVKVWDLSINEDPEEVINWLREPGVIVIAKNWNWFLLDDYNKPEKQNCSFLQRNSDLFTSKENRNVLIIVGDGPMEDTVPAMLKKEFQGIEFELPKEEEIREVLNFIIESVRDNPKFEEPSEEQKKQLVDAAKGMTKTEIKNAYSFSLVKTEGKLDPKIIAKLRAKEVENTAGLKIIETDQDFNTLRGYENLKKFTITTINHPLSKGILLLGPAGTGKTHFSRCLGNESGKILFELEVAELFSALVGSSEERVKKAIEIIIANAPCIVLIDELEKALAGVGGGGSNDGGTTKRALAQLLKFMSDTEKRKGVYIIATCNDISQLPPEWIRAGRWDSAPFFIDLPSSEEKADILKLYQEKYGVNSKPNMEGWTGAEIESCCRIASMMETSTKEASNFIVPVSKTMETEITNLRKWAKGRTITSSIISKTKTTNRSIEI